MSTHTSDENDDAQAHTTPPPFPPREGDEAGAARFAREHDPLPESCSLTTVVEALLKRPAALVYEIEQGRRWPVILALVIAMCGCLAIYGLVMGSFAGGVQYWTAPLKVAGGTVLSAMLCLPSLYIFNSLSGGRLTLPQTTGLLALFVALLGVLGLGFAPILWIFAQSTNGAAFMGFLHLACWIVGWLFGVKLLLAASTLVNRRPVALLRVWSVLFLVVTLQMSTALRPLITAPVNGLFDGGKLFFVTNWLNCMQR